MVFDLPLMECAGEEVGKKLRSLSLGKMEVTRGFHRGFRVLYRFDRGRSAELAEGLGRVSSSTVQAAPGPRNAPAAFYSGATFAALEVLLLCK